MKLIHRLDEFISEAENVPVSFRSIKTQLPLAINTLPRVQEDELQQRFSIFRSIALFLRQNGLPFHFKR
jgi:hypothetical protein